MITNDAKCTSRIKSCIGTTEASFNDYTLFTSKLDFKFKEVIYKMLHVECSFYGAETWTLLKVDRKYMKVLKFGTGEEWRRSVGMTL
jgi:hypothetical protein